jgi:uncharacterized protein
MTVSPATVPSSGLVAFRLENFRSFRDPTTLSMQATKLAETDIVRQVPVQDARHSVPLNPSAAIFGANATGKSNILIALNRVRLHVERSFKTNTPSSVAVPHEPFLLDDEYISKPTTHELDAIIDGVLYNYGFSHVSSHYTSEWAYYFPAGRSRLLFRRERTKLELGPTTRPQGTRLAKLLRPNALFLSTAAALNFKPLLPLYTWIFPRFRLAQQVNRDSRRLFTYSMAEAPPYKDQILKLVRAADLGILGLIQNRDIEMPEQVLNVIAAITAAVADAGVESPPIVRPPVNLQILHKARSGQIALDESRESHGTLVWIALLGQVVQALATGLTLLADELDASLHPGLAHQLILLFQDSISNPRGAQLIFTTHDTTILGDSSGERIIGRDQVWLSEKDTTGVSHLYSLGDVSPRKEEAIAKRYLAGRYGGTPILSQGDFRSAVLNGHRDDDDPPL